MPLTPRELCYNTQNMKRSILTILVSLAVIAAAVAAVVYMNGKKDIAAAALRKSANESEAAAAAARKAKSEAEAEASRARKAAADAEAEEKRRAAALAEAEAEKLAKETAEIAAQTAEVEAKAAADKAKAAADARATAEAELKTARAKKEAGELELKTAEAKALEAEHLKAKAEADTLKTRHSLAELNQMKEEYAQLIDETQALRADLEEMKRALTPEKTVADLMSAGGDSASAASKSNSVVKASEDRNLPKGSRALAAINAAIGEQRAEKAKRCREETIKALKALMDKAISEDRVIDARFYYSAIKDLYPDWTYVKE